jgi:hypothetical protein
MPQDGVLPCPGARTPGEGPGRKPGPGNERLGGKKGKGFTDPGAKRPRVGAAIYGFCALSSSPHRSAHSSG